MREIKFRGRQAYGSKGGRWLVGSLFVRTEDTVRGYTHMIYSGGDEGWIYVVPETVGQYTGLEDRNGKEICEGDIIDWYKKPTLENRQVVEYSDGIWWGIFNEDLNSPERFLATLGDEHKEYAVTGNRHDNPELL